MILINKDSKYWKIRKGFSDESICIGQANNIIVDLNKKGEIIAVEYL